MRTSKFKKSFALVVAAIVTVFGIAIGSNLVGAYDGSSTTPVFNAFTTETPGAENEADFVRLRNSTGDPTVPASTTNFVDPLSAACTAGQKFDIRTYIHNGANEAYNNNGNGTGVAHDVTVAMRAPLGQENANFAFSSTISASNAASVSDNGTLNCGSNVKLKLVPSTVKVYSRSLGWNSASDSAVNGTLKVGSRAFGSGDQWGCWDDRIMVVYTVEVEKEQPPVQHPDFSIVKDVRKKGDTNWMQDVTVQYGDTVEYRIVVKNTGDTDLKNVLVKDQRPTGVDYMDGTLKVNGQAATGDLFNAGVTIPEIKKGAQAEITFDAKVNKGQTGECEVKKFRNIASATPEGLQPKEDDANVNTECKEQPPVPSYECTALEAIHLGDWNFKFTTTVKMSEGVTVNKYTYNFGDNTAELNTDKNAVEHKYAKTGEYNASVRVLFSIGNEQKEARCTVKVTIPKDNCPIPGKEHLPKDSPDCKETPVVPGNPVTPVGTTPKGVDFVPATGPAEIVAGVFGTSATAYGAYALAMSRRTLKNLHK